ncbi:MAG: ATP-binding cassette domain-containing protein [Bdellovibrionales bacterium]
MLKAEKISFAYPDGTQIFHDVDITVGRGEITALLGPSGTGKTTLLKCMALLEWPQLGRITIDSKIRDFPRDPKLSLREPPWPELTVVFQQLFLWPHMTLRENIMLPCLKRDPAQTAKRLRELIDMFDMGHFIDRYPNETSRGQQQRAALARALMLEPKYILCDEITSALDVEQISKVLDCLKIVKEQNVGILLITHQLGFARRSCDHVVFMDGGTVVEAGGRERLIQPLTDRFAQFLKMVEAAH